MKTAHELAGLQFNGFFQRRLDRVQEARQYRDRLKIEKPELLVRYDEIHGSSDTKDAIDDRPYNFNLWIVDYDPESGLFLAKAKDACGNSGIVGTIRDSEIEFKKIYIPRSPEKIGSTVIEYRSPFRVINYEGRIQKPDEIITCGGTYKPEHTNENFNGTWRMDSVPIK